MKIVILYIAVVFVFLMPFLVRAKYPIEGQVLNAQTNLPVQSFIVHIDSVNYSFSAGKFSLEIGRIPVKVAISSKGYYSFSLKLNSPINTLVIHLIPETVDLQEVQVKAFNSGKRLLDQPGSIALISGQQLQTEPTFTLAPIMNNVPGVWMQSGTMNTNRLTIRGIGSRSPYGSNKIRAYFGDIPLTNGVGETTLEDLDLDQIANIEIIKGPSSGFYGSGLGGVLLFNPAKVSSGQFGQQVSVGSFNTVKYSEKLDIAGENQSHSLVYTHIRSDGYRENNQSNRHNLTWSSSVTKNQTKIDLLVLFIRADAYIPSSIDLKSFQETPQKAASNWAATRGYEDYSNIFGGLSIEQKLNKNWTAKISAFGHYNKNNELRPFNILQEKNHYQGIRSTIEKKYVMGNTFTKLIFGDEFFAENYRWQTLQNNNRAAGNILSDNKEFRQYNNLFFLTDLNLQEQFLISAGVNLNQTQYNYDDLFLSDGDQSGNHRFQPVISPRLAATWLVSEKTRFYSVVSHGFSPPTLEETLLPNGQRNLSIKPETGWKFEVGTKAKIGKSLIMEFSAYYLIVKNLLVAERTGDDAYMGINAGRTNNQGLEFSVNYEVINRPKWSSFFRMNANLTRYRFADFVDNGNDYSGNKLTGTPSSTTNWMLETKLASGFFLNLHVQTVGRMPIQDNNSLFSDAYQLTNLMGGYNQSFNHLSFSISAGVQNLLDTRYASMILINATSTANQPPRYYYPGLPRNFKSSVSLRYWF